MNKNLINKESYIESRLEDIYGRENIEVLFLAFLKYGIRVIDNLKIDLSGKNNVDEILTFNNVVVDFVNYKATVKGEKAKIGAVPIRISKVLLQYEGKALSRSQIIDRVWGKDAVLCDRAIDVYISALKGNLNLKLNIKTIRGVGYKFNYL
ncbi:winged helix-turn-helix domain-containing protein [Clostridium saudiense]|uniref:winged helix-turn-helix domain-containing protein n=1 Tax=Clostridium saudiense TaxID=1414720 RepID=UPI00319DD532